MDPFAFHPPGLSPTRAALEFSPSQQHSDPYRPASSSGASTSAGFTATLPPVQEHQASEAQSGGRPTLVGFEQLTGEDPNAPGSSHGYPGAFGQGATTGEAGEANLPSDEAAGAGAKAGEGAPSFRDPFARALSPSASAGEMLGQAGTASIGSAAYGAPSSHAYFNPQTVNPSVNTRNTRPMTAPSGPGYFNPPSYASTFYAPAQQSQASAFSGLDLPLPTAAATAAAGSSFSYAADGAVDYEGFRARGFSLPDVSETGVVEEPSPTGSTPFFYAPPPTAGVPQGTAASISLRPATATTAGAYYPSILENGTTFLHPLVASTSQLLSHAPPGTMLDMRPGSSGGPSAAAAAAAAARRRSSGSLPLGSLPAPQMPQLPSAAGPTKTYNFVQQGGQATKRPRRRYDEIERLYDCDYPGCTKAYGTLNHLNSHKMMQKHGPKSTPAQFKEMRKAWRERKKAEAAAAARARAAAPPPDPLAATSLPPAFTVPAHLERPRPSTSAGEYHYTMPAPFMTPLGAPVVAAYSHQPAATAASFPLAAAPHHNLAQAQPGTYVDHQATHTATWQTPLNTTGAGTGYDPYGSSLRPVTAPSYHVAPSFGGAPAAPASFAYSRLANGASAPSLSSSAGAPAPSSAAYSLGAAASADRRLSLPSSSLSGALNLGSATLAPAPAALPDSPEMKMPQPVLGYQTAGHAALIALGGGGGGTGAGSARDGPFASLGLATGGAGEAKLVLDDGAGDRLDLPSLGGEYGAAEDGTQA
ncbi:hypothetical protein JCM10213_005270 [Rhodosporidiobolus nylandii]